MYSMNSILSHDAPQHRSASDQTLITLLAFAGTLPMLACVLFSDWSLSERLFRFYSLAIVAFLAGAWWATALMQRRVASNQIRQVLILSNAIVIVGFLAASLLESSALLVLAVLYICLLMGEARFSVFANQPAYYQFMRRSVTTVVVLLHISAFFIL